MVRKFTNSKNKFQPITETVDSQQENVGQKIIKNIFSLEILWHRKNNFMHVCWLFSYLHAYNVPQSKPLLRVFCVYLTPTKSPGISVLCE